MKILSYKKYGVKLKATIQATGKLGFPKGTSDVLDFANKKYVTFSQSEDDGELFLAVSPIANDDAFKINVSSGYYSLNTTGLFDALGIDYHDNTVIFDLLRVVDLDEELSGEVYKMSKRTIVKNVNNMES